MTDETLIQKDDFAKEDFAASYMVGEKMSIHEMKRTINAIADELYRPPWK